MKPCCNYESVLLATILQACRIPASFKGAADVPEMVGSMLNSRLDSSGSWVPMVWGPLTTDGCSSITPIPHDTSCRPSLRQQCKIDKLETSSIRRYLQGTRFFPSCPTQKMSMRIGLPKLSFLSKAILSSPQQCMQDSFPTAEHAGVARCRPALASSC